MPKIVIREFDKTKAGIANYANFTVVVPGYVSEESMDVFDEYGVYECSDQAEFVKNIGKIPAEGNVRQPATAPNKEEISGYTLPGEEEGTTVDVTLTTATIDQLKQIKAALAEEGFGLYFAEARTDGGTDIGYLKDDENKYIAIEDTWTEFDAAQKTFYKIKGGEEGEEARYAAVHMGNQIAYELLGLGYTVLYKRFTDISDLTDDNFYGAEGDDNGFWDPLKDKAMYDFRYVVTGFVSGGNDVNNKIINLVHAANNTSNTGRGDCIALLDIDRNAYSTAATQKEAISGIIEESKYITASKYAALFAPTVTYARPADVYNNSTFPASFHYLACAARAAESYNEWYAVAGYTRGVSNWSIESVGCKLGEAAIEALEPRHKLNELDKAVNLVIKIKNSYYLWGNRTAELLGEAGGSDGDLRASHFLNIRQLCTTIKKQVYVACRRFTFDPNSDVLWINFCNSLKPTLEKMKADQGISDYKFVKVKSAQKALLTAKIRIVPIEAVEDFDISITLEDSLGGVTTGIDEQEVE